MFSQPGGIERPVTSARRRRRRRRWIGVLVVVVALAAGVVWLAAEVLRSCGSLGSGVDEIDGDCVGVTDGSFVFHPELANVQGRIETENARVRATAPSAVTVALLDPLTPRADDPLTPMVESSALPPAQVRHRLEGAYTALRRVNTTTVAGDTRPQIQLVLANPGSTDNQREHVIGQLVQMSERDERPLVAVVGLGVSTKHTQQRAEALSDAGIPLVGAAITADVLNYAEIPDLIRTSPSNRHYVEALHGYLDSTDLTSAVVVRDSNSHRGKDLFTQNLAEDFDRQMADVIKFSPLEFTGKAIPSQADPGLFANVTTNICAAAGNGLQTILYAGRAVDINSFLLSLEDRPCPRAPLTILTAGSDLGEILEGREQDLRAANLKIVVASTVDAEGWKDNVTGTPQHFDEFLSALREHGFDRRQLTDGGAIMMHDALLAAARAVRLAAPEGAMSRPTSADVRAQLLNLHGYFAVPGASGTLNFSANSKVPGNPVGKPVPVLQYPRPSDGPSRQVGPLYHVTD